MLYLFIDKNRVKLLYVKKTLLGQYESAFYEKKHGVDFLTDDGKIASTDLIASAIKEAISSLMPSGVKDKDVFLIVPPSSFEFMRIEVPGDIAPSAINSFVHDKAQASLAKESENYFYDFLVSENEKQKYIVFYAIEKELIQQYQEVLSLVDLQLINMLPDTLSYFKLFEKTLRKDKKENILYVLYETDLLTGHLYDSYGPQGEQVWKTTITSEESAEEVLKKKTTEYETQGKKLNRLILSGENSDDIRQDTFTKNVGVWTNPLKRIIPQFYQDYLKVFIVPTGKTLPLLQYDVCIGAFIFSLENKGFSLIKKKFAGFSKPSLPTPSFKIPAKREVGIFVVSFVLSFATFFLISKLSGGGMTTPKLPTLFAAKPTATPTPIPPTPTPTVAINKKEIKVKVLNGSGVKGKATEVKDILKEKGYEDILTGNADNFDYAVTEIQVKADKKSLGTTLTEDLKDYTSSPKLTELDEKETADAVVIFGKDFK